MAGFLLFCVYTSLLCILISLCRGIVRSALPDGGFALFGLLNSWAPQAQRHRAFLRAQSKKP
ncbi:hypothetical protein, partial [Enterobacter asburiae]|uniref:hypothetical protein n=1 Tax=Enterobacter asburiae TaxID=61645 RepID=UPI001C401014